MSTPIQTPQKHGWFKRDWGHLADLVRTIKTTFLRPEEVCKTYQDPRSHRYLGPVAAALSMLALLVITRQGLEVHQHAFDPDFRPLWVSVEKPNQPDSTDLLKFHSIGTTPLGSLQICLTPSLPDEPKTETDSSAEEKATASDAEPKRNRQHTPGNELACVWTVADRKGSAEAYLHYPSLDKDTTRVVVQDATTEVWSETASTNTAMSIFVLGQKWFEELMYSELWVLFSAVLYGALFALIFRKRKLPFKEHIAFSLYIFAVSFFVSTLCTLGIFVTDKVIDMGDWATATTTDLLATVLLVIWLPYCIRRNYQTALRPAIVAGVSTMIASVLITVIVGLGGSYFAALIWYIINA